MLNQLALRHATNLEAVAFLRNFDASFTVSSYGKAPSKILAKRVSLDLKASNKLP